jgi:hypothetical protein
VTMTKFESQNTYDYRQEKKILSNLSFIHKIRTVGGDFFSDEVQRKLNSERLL